MRPEPSARTRNVRILVVGGVTIDTIHLPDREKPFRAPGGAGYYTALGAMAAGGEVTLFAQRPDPLPEILEPVAQILDWQGPSIAPDELPKLEIAHYGGGKADLRSADWGAQLRLTTAELPPALAAGALCHIAALGPTANQTRFAMACRESGAWGISAGTYARAVYGEPEEVRELLARSDFFSMNENEAAGLFGSATQATAGPDQVLFVTLAARGAAAITLNRRIFQAAPAVKEVNPTGAGDTFCGAALAVLAGGGRLDEALETGVRLASRRVGERGGL